MAKVHFVLVGLALVSILVNAQTPSTRADKAIKDDNQVSMKIDAYLKQGTENGFSGTVLVAKQGKVIFSRGYGYADKHKQRLNSPETVFTTGSVTKQFTATAILKLKEQGLLKVTDPLNTFFSDLPEDKKDITVHELLTHSAGLVDVIGNGDFDYIPTNQFFARLFATKLLHEPGTKYAYSNAGYSVLARIIELVSGQEYESFLQQYLFRPAGMTRTGYFHPDWKKEQLALGYARGFMPMGTMIERYQRAGSVSWVLKGNGGIHSTSLDMFKWYEALRNNSILNKTLTEQLTTPYVLEYADEDSYYAYGWAIYSSDRGTKIVTHNGGNRIFFHEFIWFPEEDVSVIYFTNASSRETEVTWRISKLVFDPDTTLSEIKKNPYLLVYDYVMANDLGKVDNLLSLLKNQNSAVLRNSNILNELGYLFLDNEPKIDWATELFRLNTTLFPEVANVWDSLGDGYKRMGNEAKAIDSYLKANKLDPYLQASIKSLKELGVDVEPVEAKPVLVDQNILQRYTGEYELSPNMTIRVSLKEGQLMVQPSGRNVIPAIARTESKFFVEIANSYIEFNANADGVIDSLTLTAGGNQMRGTRLPD